MNIVQVWSSAVEAASLLAAYPLSWLSLVAVFLVVVEGIMFVPYIGFIVKLYLASIIGAQALALFALASAGQAPQLMKLLGAFALPPSAQVALFAAALLPFLVGLVYLFVKGGSPAVSFFFGNILKVKPPSQDLFLRFKAVMHLLSLPFTFLAGAVVLKGLSGWAAVTTAVSVAISNWLVLVALLVLALCFEWSIGRIPPAFPKAVGAPLAGVILVFFVAWSFAFLYTLSAHALEHVPASQRQVAI